MGNLASSIYLNRPPELPESHVKPTFDSEYGFDAPRKARVSKISEQEMRALQIPKLRRDYCAHLYKDYMVCARAYTPFLGMCNPERHAYEHCQMEDYVIRMKEYEREKRLRMRQLRKQQQAA